MPHRKLFPNAQARAATTITLDDAVKRAREDQTFAPTKKAQTSTITVTEISTLDSRKQSTASDVDSTWQFVARSDCTGTCTSCSAPCQKTTSNNNVNANIDNFHRHAPVSAVRAPALLPRELYPLGEVPTSVDMNRARAGSIQDDHSDCPICRTERPDAVVRSAPVAPSLPAIDDHHDCPICVVERFAC